ncbi:MAG: 2-oxoacid:acceptor oxidoreductase subunit alpha [Deltaproteobacteria bacterium]|nr:2-oxoacid:acceptor oxidoreductase subunit alpha [Deltaproteobacteria bacterium]
MVETNVTTGAPERPVHDVESVVIRFAGDSGDGMQVTGTQFTTTSFMVGNDLSTLPDFPAEIRAPQGTLAGVSGFQLQFSSQPVHTPGDRPDVLVCMNPAALKVNMKDLPPGAIIIANSDEFSDGNLRKAGFAGNPLEDGALEGFQLFRVDVTRLTRQALFETELSNREKDRCKNFYALGLLYWLYNRPLDATVAWIGEKFGKKPEIAEANVTALHAGYHYGETTEAFAATYRVAPATIASGTYRNVTGNTATALGLVTASQLSGLSIFYGSYPITPASDILHDLSRYKNYGVVTFQAEDEIAGICSAIGASYGGSLGVTATSGPGLALKSEAMGMAVSMELPLIVIDVMRAGPSTGLPTKPEQADLLMVLFGRHGECPMPVLAPGTPSECFDIAILAARLAVRYMTPMVILSDAFLANSSEPWRVPAAADLPPIEVEFRTDPEGFGAYRRDPETLARPWVKPGTPELMHRVGGLEKDAVTGNVSYDPANHEIMVHTRAEKIARIADALPPLVVDGEREGDLLILGWGSTTGAISKAVATLREEGLRVSGTHLISLAPFQKDLGALLAGFRRVLIPELNTGHLRFLLRATYGLEATGLNKIQGRPLRVDEIADAARALLVEN